jgi:hypothetical protein
VSHFSDSAVQAQIITIIIINFVKNHNAYNYNNVLDDLKLNTVLDGRRYIDVIFIRNAYNGFITCSSLLETVGIRVTNENLKRLQYFLHFVFTQQMSLCSLRLSCQ